MHIKRNFVFAKEITSQITLLTWNTFCLPCWYWGTTSVPRSFVWNASVNVFVFKLSEKLSGCPTFTYYIGGDPYCEPKELHLTNKEIIEHAARSVFSCGQTQEIKHVREKPAQAAIVLVGTFKDQSDSQVRNIRKKARDSTEGSWTIY